MPEQYPSLINYVLLFAIHIPGIVILLKDRMDILGKICNVAD